MKVSKFHAAWLKATGNCRTRQVALSILASHMNLTVAEVEAINDEMGGGNDNGWDVESVTTPKAWAGDKLWAYLNAIKLKAGTK